MTGPRFGAQPIVRVAPDGLPFAIPPQNMFYGYLSHLSGPEGDDDEMMNSDSDVEASVFAVTVPEGVQLQLARINFGIIDGNPTIPKFGGLNALANGCDLAIHAPDDSVVLDLTGGRPLKQNSDFIYLAGDDMDLQIGAGLDLVKVRFSVFKAGASVMMLPGYSVRMTIHDDLSDLVEFRAQVQGLLEPA